MNRGFVVMLLALAACAGSTDVRREADPRTLVDLTHAFDADTIYWPTEEGFVLERGFAGTTPGGWHYEAHRFRSAEHGGTHVDAPIHFAAGRRSTEAIPLESLVGPGVVIDVSQAAARDRDHAISLGEIVAWESAHGALPAGAIVLFRTGFGAFWPDRARYLGTAERGAAGVAKLHFPGLGEEAARWLVRERARTRRRHRHREHRSRRLDARSRRIACSAKRTCRRSRTWRRSTGCRRAASRWSRCR